MVTDSDFAINAAIIIQFSNTFIYIVSQKLLKQLKGKLDSNFSDFMKDFYIAKNSLKEKQFDERNINYYYYLF